MQSEKLEQYLAALPKMEGGPIYQGLWDLTKALARLQAAEGVTGPVCEIGVHHGRFMIGLMLIANSDRKSLGIDVFDLQQYNMDHSGHGNREAFLSNVRKHVGEGDKVGTIEADSLSLSSPDVLAIHAEYGKFAMFSVDGCHTAEHTYHDLKTAAELTTDGGIVFVDDYYHPNFPGVQEGVCQYFFKEQTKLAPIAFSGGRLILTDASHHERYYSELRRQFTTGNGHRVVACLRFGWQTLTMTHDRRRGRPSSPE